MGGLHWYDLAVLFGLAILFFGPKRMPELGSAVGKTIKEFRKSMTEITEPANPTPAVPPAAPIAQTPALPASTASSAPTALPAAAATSEATPE